MKLVRLPDLAVTFSPDGAALVRSGSRGVAAKVPPPVLPLLAFCSQPRAAEEIERAFGPQIAALFGRLAEVGILAPPEQVQQGEVFFTNFADIDVHRRMLADRVRMEAFRQAITAQVHPGAVVLDAGTGSGVLAVMAAKAGARRVYAVDNSELLELAQQVVRSSGVEDRVQLIRGDFSRVRLPEPVDLIVSETIGALAFAEGAGPDLSACVAQNLKPGGQVIPRGIQLWLAPLNARRWYDETVSPFDQPELGLAPLLHLALRRARRVQLGPEDLLLPAQPLLSTPWPVATLPAGRAAFTPEVDCTGWCFGAWFTLDLGAGVLLQTGPADPRTHWDQQLLPSSPVQLQAGEPLEVHVGLRADPADRRGLELDWELRQGTRRWRLQHHVR